VGQSRERRLVLSRGGRWTGTKFNVPGSTGTGHRETTARATRVPLGTASALKPLRDADWLAGSLFL